MIRRMEYTVAAAMQRLEGTTFVTYANEDWAGYSEALRHLTGNPDFNTTESSTSTNDDTVIKYLLVQGSA